METGISEHRRRAYLRRDIEGQTDPPTSFHIWRSIAAYERHVVGLSFLVLETGAAVLDGIGKGKLGLLLAAFAMSTIGFSITLCTYVKRRARSSSTREVPAVSQLSVVELVFSSIQWIASLSQVLLAHLKDKQILDVKNNIDASVFPVAFAMVGVVFIFKNDEAITKSSQKGSQQQVTGTSARNEDSLPSLVTVPESSSATLVPANNVPQEGSQQQVKRDLIGTARNQDSPSILDQMTEFSSATELRAPFINNAPPPLGRRLRKVLAVLRMFKPSSARKSD